MNLTASSSVQEMYPADLAMLPHQGQWRTITMDQEEVLLWSWIDMKACFYIFRLPDCWAPYFAFDHGFDSQALGLSGPRRTVHLGSVTLPMGWISAMGLAQYLHRQMHIRGTGGPCAGLPLDREVRKDKPVPALASGRQPPGGLWQIYADDFDVIERAKDEEEAAALQLESAEWYRAAHAAYDHWNAPHLHREGR